MTNHRFVTTKSILDFLVYSHIYYFHLFNTYLLSTFDICPYMLGIRELVENMDWVY